MYVAVVENAKHCCYMHTVSQLAYIGNDFDFINCNANNSFGKNKQKVKLIHMYFTFFFECESQWECFIELGTFYKQHNIIIGRDWVWQASRNFIKSI